MKGRTNPNTIKICQNRYKLTNVEAGRKTFSRYISQELRSYGIIK